MTDLVVVFVTGLTTGGLSCLAVQGGLLASSIARQVEEDVQATLVAKPAALPKGKKRRQALAQATPIAPARPKHVARPIALFLGAKLVAYTLLGALLGWLGSVLQLTPTVRGILQIAIGIYMVGNALRMFEVHPIFRYFVFEPPRSLTRFIRRTAKNSSSEVITPLFLGLLTVLIPCGVTQAMMALAVGSGNPLAGAAIMAAFTLGTSPTFFTLAYLATRLGGALEARVLKVAAIAVLVLGLISVNTGLNLLGSPLSLNNVARALLPAAAAPATPGSVTDLSAIECDPKLTSCAANGANGGASTESGQADTENTITVRALNDGYFPASTRAKAGQPVRLDLVTDKTYSCAQAFVIPALRIERLLPPSGVTSIDLPPQKAGSVLRFTCSMGMYGGQIRFE